VTIGAELMSLILSEHHREFDGIEIKIPLINVVDKRIFVGFLGIREESDYSIDVV
jgi:hypothetical protein